MCLIAMEDKELEGRLKKYKYTSGFIGATGCWHYSQIEKSLVTDQDDISFFNEREVKRVGSSQILSDDKWTFDGIPNYTYLGNFVDYGITKQSDIHINWLPLENSYKIRGINADCWFIDDDIVPYTNSEIVNEVVKGFSYMEVYGT